MSTEFKGSAKALVAGCLSTLIVMLFILGFGRLLQEPTNKPPYKMVVPPGYDCFMVGDTVTCHPVVKEVSHGDGFDRP